MRDKGLVVRRMTEADLALALQWRRSDPSPEEAQQRTPGSPAKETGSGAKDSGKVSKENPSANWAFSMGYDDPAQKPFSPLLPAPLLEAARSATGPLYPWFLIIARKSRALIALAVVGEGIGSMAEVADGAIKASWPGLSRPSPKAQRIYAGKREKPCDRPPSCRSRRGGTRSCGGPAWMAGTSPAMTARVRRTNSQPVDQQITP